MTDKDQVDISDLAAYDSDDEAAISTAIGQEPAQEPKQGTHVDIHTAGFRDLYLKPEILRAITDSGFEHPSTVQSECIPQANLGKDVICQAASGMGKTAVFVFSVLQQLNPVDGEVSCLVLCHIRELAYQAKHEFDRFKKYLPDIRTEVFFGGTPVAKDRETLKNNTPHIVIGTPGRILQLAEEGALKLNNVKHFIIDECDEVLEKLDMRRDVQQIFKKTPRQKQVMMFSATLSDAVKPVIKRFMHDPLEIYINDGSKLTLHGLQQYYVELEEEMKTRKLCDLLDTLEFNQVVIFVRSVQRAKVLSKVLNEETFPSVVIHSRMKQSERIERYRQFKEFKARIIVSTNLFGRGVDFERVNFVINYDMAEISDTYLHRVGRAGRFGTKGLAISFISSEEDKAVLEDVRSKFAVPIPELPSDIDQSTYMLA